MAFVLPDEYRTGVDIIDEQHTQILSLADELREKNMDEEEVVKTLNFLGEYVSMHFRMEEDLQASSEYPAYEHHTKLHNDFFDRFMELNIEFNVSGATSELRKELINSVVNWVINHVLQEDKIFAEHYKKTMNV